VLENIETGMVRIRVVERKIHRGRTGLASAKRTTRGKDDMTGWRKVKVMESWRMESQRMQAENRRTFKEFVGRVVVGESRRLRRLSWRDCVDRERSEVEGRTTEETVRTLN